MADTPSCSVRLFQITEDDLAELERILPQITDVISDRLSGRLRTQIRRVQTIMSNVRWNYGPPTDVTIIPNRSEDG